jgi:hypothetical protein
MPCSHPQCPGSLDDSCDGQPPRGIVTSNVVPPPAGLEISNRPGTASTRVLEPDQPRPAAGRLAAPTPSSLIDIRSSPFSSDARSWISDAWAYFAVFVNASPTT